jgi:hypothetical protein
MAVIDLDLRNDEEPSPPARGARLLAAVVVLCGLLILGAPERPPVPWAQEVARIAIRPGGVLNVAGDLLIISGAQELMAYDVASGRERWRTDTRISGGEVWAFQDLLLASGADPKGLDEGQFRPRSVAIERATGRVLWRVDGSITSLRGLLVLYGEAMIALLREDGTKIWTLDGGGITPAIDQKTNIVATLDKRTGELVERVMPSLIELRRAILPGALGADGMWFYDGTLNIFHADQDIFRYDAATLQALPQEPIDTFRVDCGRVWCMISEGELVDKATGAVVYETRNWEYALSNDAGVLGLGILIGDGEPTLVREIFDPRTGTATDLEGWVAVNLVSGAPVSATDPRVLLAYRGEKASYLDIFDDHGLRRLGVLPTRDLAQCALSGPDASQETMLACRVGAELVRLWRLT